MSARYELTTKGHAAIARGTLQLEGTLQRVDRDGRLLNEWRAFKRPICAKKLHSEMSSVTNRLIRTIRPLFSHESTDFCALQRTPRRHCRLNTRLEVSLAQVRDAYLRARGVDTRLHLVTVSVSRGRQRQSFSWRRVSASRENRDRTRQPRRQHSLFGASCLRRFLFYPEAR